MKILIATTYIYRKEWPEFTRNRTGFGIMVNDIFKSVSEDVDTYLLSQVITNGHEKVLKHTWLDVFGASRPKDWIKGFKYFFGCKQGIKNRCRYFYYALNTGAIRNAIKTIKPDIVHIHSIGVAVQPYIDACEETKVPYIVTLHGLIGLDDSVRVAQWDKQIEKNFLIEAETRGIPVTVISTGMKRRIEENYLHHIAENIVVVQNGTKIPYNEQLLSQNTIDLKTQYNLQRGEKIVVVIGSICERKNQIQIVRAFATGRIKQPSRLFLCGVDNTDGQVQKEIISYGLADRIQLLGFVSHKRIEQILRQSDLNVVASRDEGFGLSIIEAYSYGVPTVAFSDLNAIPDLYDERAMIKVNVRDDSTLGEAIEDGLIREWDKEWIREYAKGFSLEKLVEKYKAEYKQALMEGQNTSIAKTCDFLSIQRKFGYKILSYIGNITDNKNQMELAKIMRRLKENKVIAVFVGNEVDRAKVRRYVIENNIDDCVILAGFCSEMDSIWINVDLNVLLSKNDGFGLSIIEGYIRGIPSVMNSNLDAYEDVKIESSLIGTAIGSVSDELKAIVKALDVDWEENKIIDESVAFSLEKMAEMYIAQYQRMLENNGGWNTDKNQYMGG